MASAFVLFASILCSIFAHGYSDVELTSPCPEVFLYQTSDALNTARNEWHGIVNLESDEDVTGVELKLTLDKPAQELNSASGDVSTSDNVEYVISNKTLVLFESVSNSIGIYVTYEDADSVPQVEKIELNGRTICSAQKRQSRQLFLNGFLRPEQSVLFTYEIDQLLCGVTAAQENFFYRNTQVFDAVKYPWHASIFYYDLGKLKYACSGTLISRQYVITAAHCIQGFAKLPLRAVDLQVHLGKYYLNSELNPGLQIHEASDIVIHPHYSRINYANNLALIKLKAPVQYDDFVRPACLWKGDTSLDHVIGTPGTAVGWGLNDKSNVTENLRDLVLSPDSYKECQTSDVSAYFQYQSEGLYCAGAQNGTSICQGDAGGGMVFLRETLRGSIYFLRGVISAPKRFFDRCDSTQNIRFTDVAKYLDFINTYLK